MPDVDLALRWSKHAASTLYVNDFVGPTRFQWPDEQLATATKVRAALPARLLGDTPVTVRRPDPDRLAALDPTESADSGNILRALREHFPDATVKLTGGIVYHLALNDVLANFTADDGDLLERLLLQDDQCVASGQTHYAVAVLTRWSSPRRAPHQLVQRPVRGL